MGAAPAYPTDSNIVGGMSHAGSVSFMSTTNSVTSERDPVKDSTSKVGFPTDSSIAAVSYTSAKHSLQKLVMQVSATSLYLWMLGIVPLT